jgi:hypothetical protein
MVLPIPLDLKGKPLLMAAQKMVRRPSDTWVFACTRPWQKPTGKANIRTRVENISFVFREDDGRILRATISIRLTICHAN